MSRAANPKQPFQWWCWDDYENDPALKLCSWGAQGVWMRMLHICWDSPRRGYFLLDNGQAPTTPDLAALWGKPVETIVPAMADLEARGVFSRDESGVIFSRRMVRREAKKAQDQKEGEATPTERELMDLAVREQLDVAAREADRKAKQRERTNRCRAKKKAQSGLTKMQAFEHMAAAAARSDARAAGQSVTPEAVSGDVTPPVTVTLQGVDVTLHNSREISGVTAVSPPLSSIFHLQEEESEPDHKRTARSLATLTGGSLAERDEGQATPRALQERIAARLARAPIQAPSETDEAFAARCAAATAGQADAA